MDANDKPHAVCMPSPAQGHINAMLQLAKLLHSLHDFHITFVLTRLNFNRILSTSAGDELPPFCNTVQSDDLNQPSSFDVLPDFRCEAIPDGLQRSDPNSGEELSELCDSVRNNLADHFRQLVKRLNHENRGPKVTCIVSDTYSSFTLDIAAEIGVPDVSFCSVSACGFWGFYCFKELLERGIVPLKSEDDLSNGYLETCIDWIPGKSMRLRDFPSFVRTTNPNDSVFNFCKDESENAKKANAIIINTFNDLEAPVLDAMSAQLPPVYAVGPLTLMCDKIRDAALKNFRFNLWQEESACLQWLDRKANGSVVYVNFGSMAVLSSEQLVEFAWGLADSGREFLWVIRSNMVSGDLATLLPAGFSSAVTSERGLLTSWCPQGEVLMHPAIGVFMTHCGWNSTMESISRGVPMICWPYFGDQQTNCYYACNEWGIGVELGNDVKRKDVEGLIREILGGEKGKEMREMTLKWKESAIRSTEPGGKSFMNMEKVIREVLLEDNKHI